MAKKTLNAAQKSELLRNLEQRFTNHMSRHKGIDWADVVERLESNPSALWSLEQMERSGGEPDVIGREAASEKILFVDCAAESPKERRSLCYDRAALDARKEHKPANSAMDLAAEMGVQLLDEASYRHLQSLGAFDCKTSSWILTPPAIRDLGGALFCDRRYDAVFTYHNGAESYYAARGFRAMLAV